MAQARKGGPRARLEVGDIVERRQNGRFVLLAQEHDGPATVITTVDEGFDLVDRGLGRAATALRDAVDETSAFNLRLGHALAETSARIDANQRALEALVASRS